MADNGLEIRLKVVDEASEPIKTSLQGIKGAADSVKQSGTAAGKDIQEEFRKAGRELKEFRQSLFIVTAGLAAIISTTREAIKYNAEAKTTYDRFTTSIQALTATVGSALSPALEGVTVLVNILRDTVEAVIAGFIKMFSLITETFVALWDSLKNVADNIKNFFTRDEDPIGIVEGFRQSFQRAFQIADQATDQFLEKIESTRARVESGNTLKAEEQQLERINIIKKKTEDQNKKETFSVNALSGALGQLNTAFSSAEESNKGFAKAAAAIALSLAIINTATGVTKAFADYSWPFSMVVAGIVAAAGAIQIATIASQKFAEGTDSVRKFATGTDTVPAMLSPGEMVIPRTFSDAIRDGALSLGGPRSVTGGNDGITINVYGGNFNSREMISQMAEQIGFEIERRIGGARFST